jgi:hypothetical protein
MSLCFARGRPATPPAIPARVENERVILNAGWNNPLSTNFTVGDARPLFPKLVRLRESVSPSFGRYRDLPARNRTVCFPPNAAYQKPIMRFLAPAIHQRAKHNGQANSAAVRRAVGAAQPVTNWSAR